MAALARRAVPVAVVAAVLAVAALVVSAVLHWQTALDTHARINAFWPLSWAGLPIVGTVIVVRRPEHVLGWILVLVGVCFGIGLGALAYADSVLRHGTSLPAPLVALAVSQSITMPGFAAVAFLLLLFPEGRLPSRRWRGFAWIGAGVFGALWACYLFRGSLEFSHDGVTVTRFANPLAVASLADPIEVLIPVVAVLAAVFVVVTIGRVVVRSVRATGAEQAQLKWFAAAAAAFPLLWLAAVQLDRVDRDLAEGAVVGAWVIATNGVAAAIGIAILRYRLFEIDRIVRRTVAYATVTMVLAGVYGATVVGLGTLGRAVAGGATSDLAVAASTLVVVAAFGPVRRRVRDVVDRRFDRARYDAARTVEVFGQRLRDQVDLERVVAELQVAAAGAVLPRHLSLWLPHADRATP